MQAVQSITVIQSWDCMQACTMGYISDLRGVMTYVQTLVWPLGATNPDTAHVAISLYLDSASVYL